MKNILTVSALNVKIPKISSGDSSIPTSGRDERSQPKLAVTNNQEVVLNRQSTIASNLRSTTSTQNLIQRDLEQLKTQSETLKTTIEELSRLLVEVLVADAADSETRRRIQEETFRRLAQAEAGDPNFNPYGFGA